MKVEVNTIYDNLAATYVSGETVTGRINFQLQEETTLKGIQLRFLGETNVLWTETESYYACGVCITQTKKYTNKEVYFDAFVLLREDPSGEFVLGPGEHSYPFLLVLPPNTPSSFEGGFGSIRYSVNTIFVRPKKKDKSFSSIFSVLNNTDLNTDTKLMESIRKTEEKFLCCFCCSSGPINMVVTLPFQGLAIGQVCEAVLEIDNVTKKVVTGKVILYQKVVYIARNGSLTKKQKVTKSIVEETLGEVKGGDSKTFTTSLRIPEIPVSHQQIAQAITISYYLEFLGVVSGMHLNASLQVPIEIGNIPLVNTLQSLNGNKIEHSIEEATDR